MREGDRIRLITYIFGYSTGAEDYTVELFRHCLGIFGSEEHREAGSFTPLCELYEAGPESERLYISNFGEYTTNMVPSFMNLQRPKDGA